jgi:phage terminase large subunit-like protein
VWAQTVVDLYRKWKAQAVVVELNQGQKLVEMALKSIDPNIKVIGVNASQGKRLRAEPTTLPYQQGRVHHVGYFPELEDQLTSWEPEHSKYSPDRLDALVHGVTALLIKPPKGMGGAALRGKSSGRRQLPTGRGTGQTRAGGELGRTFQR